MSDYLLSLIGLAFLLGGAELLVRNAVSLASSLGRSRLMIGLTVAAFGTSAPELAIGMMGVIDKQPDIGLGNIVGSNIFNILFVVGLATLVRPLVVSRKVIRRDIPILLGISVIFLLISLDGAIGVTDAVVLTGLLVAYLIYMSRHSIERMEVATPGLGQQSEASNRTGLLIQRSGLIALSLVLLAAGSHWLVTGAVSIATGMGMSELAVGLTFVAVGTSLPEIATTLAAVRKREHELAIGNVIGSCIFNIIVVPAAMTAVNAAPFPIAGEVAAVDVPIMIAAVVACLPVFFSDHRVSRPEGLLFLGYYVAYAVALYVRASSNPVITEYKFVAAALVIPIVSVTIVIVSIRALKYRRRIHTSGEMS